MSNALLATGTLIKIDDGLGVYVTVAELRDINGPELVRQLHDASTHNSPGTWDEVLPGRARSGEVTFQINYIPTDATHNQTVGLLFLFKNKTKRNMQLVFPDGSMWTWAGYVTKVGPAAPVDGILTGDIAIKADGALAFSV